ncbi:hypothetical protein CK224_25835 [Mesorhizobium sp. WSM3862]|nr:hypothetical protein CK224_25835 [Mesorhizobium sp. WSM3862]
MLVDLWLSSYAAPPKSVTLDVDDTLDVVHGHQQLSLFNAFRALLPSDPCLRHRHRRPVAMILRPGKTGEEIRGYLRRIPLADHPYPDAWRWPLWPGLIGNCYSRNARCSLNERAVDHRGFVIIFRAKLATQSGDLCLTTDPLYCCCRSYSRASDIFSATIMVGIFVFARGQNGITDASATLKPDIP